MEVTTRRAVADDVAAILGLWHELMELHAGLDPQFRLVHDAARQAETHLRAEIDTPTSLLIVAVHSSSIVGYCRASVRQHSPIFEQRSHGFVSELHVSSSARRRGVGRKLFQHVRGWLGDQGISRLEVVTIHANDGSKAFWRSVGCVPCAERRFVELTAQNA